MSGILTEEDLKEWEEDTRELLSAVSDYRIKKLISVVRINKQINKSLVLENDEQTAEIMMRIKYEGFLRSVIRCKGTLEDSEDYDWFKERHAAIIKSLEETK